MRILHLLHQYLPEKIGGVELYTRTLAQRQAANGRSVAIFTPSARAASAAPTVEEGVRVYRAPTGERGGTAVFLSSFRHPALTQAFDAVLEREEPDIVHIQHLMGLPIALADRLLQRRIPYLVTLHDYWHLCANAQLITNYDHTLCNGPDRGLNCARCALARAGKPELTAVVPAIAPLFRYRQGRLRRLLAQAEALIAPTQFTRHIHAQMGVDPRRITVIGHGIQPPALMPPRQETPDSLRVAYIGGISWQKGVHILIEALNQLPPQAVQAAIVGDLAAFPDYAAQLQAQTRHPNVRFTGRLAHDQLWSLLAATDLVVVPTLWYETASLIVQEAFAAGVPVAASNIGVMGERVNDGVDGRLFPAGDADALRDLLQSAIEKPALLAQWRRGIRPVKTIESHVADVDALYANALPSQSPPAGGEAHR